MRLPVLLASTCLWGLSAGCAQQADEQRPPAVSPAQALRDRATLDELRALVRREYRQQDYAQARTDLLTLGRRYPHARTHPPLAQLAGQLDSLNQAQRRREQARQRRRAGQVAPSA